MYRRRIELQLRLLRALLRRERRRRDPEALTAFAERTVPILERVALEIEAEADAELNELLAAVRAEVNSARFA